MHNSCLIMLATNTMFAEKARTTLPKLHVKFQPDPIKIFLAKVEKVKKRMNYA